MMPEIMALWCGNFPKVKCGYPCFPYDSVLGDAINYHGCIYFLEDECSATHLTFTITLNEVNEQKIVISGLKHACLFSPVHLGLLLGNPPTPPPPPLHQIVLTF